MPKQPGPKAHGIIPKPQQRRNIDVVVAVEDPQVPRIRVDAFAHARELHAGNDDEDAEEGARDALEDGGR